MRLGTVGVLRVPHVVVLHVPHIVEFKGTSLRRVKDKVQLMFG